MYDDRIYKIVEKAEQMRKDREIIVWGIIFFPADKGCLDEKYLWQFYTGSKKDLLYLTITFGVKGMKAIFLLEY